VLSAIDIQYRGPVGWLLIKAGQEMTEQSWEVDEYIEIHTAVGKALEELRFDPAVRVIGITGQQNGEWFHVPRYQRYFDEQRHRDRHNMLERGRVPRLVPEGPGRGFPSPLESLALMEKPVVARLNGDATGFGQSLLWGCDLIVAIENVIVSDSHMAQGEVVDSAGERRGFPYALSPGDGALAFWPLFLPPTKAKEFQLLSRAWTSNELAEMNIINYVLPTYEKLDAKVDEIITQLLARPDHALRRTKRLMAKQMINQWNLTMDLSHAYEMLDFWEHTRDGHMEPTWAPEAIDVPDGGWCPATEHQS
jgi:enoyl-CoA hydratase/carnithine racemase